MTTDGTQAAQRTGFTLFVSGNDTDVGKTHVMGLLVRALAARGYRVDVVKALETGTADPAVGDARHAAGTAQRGRVTHRTLLSFRRPLAPLAAARAAGRPFTFADLVAQVRRLPAVDCRLIEGAGGLAVPLDEAGHDWADFARAIRADATLLVVEDRLGAINQGRLLAAYAKSKRLPRPLFLLNRIRPLAPAIQSSNREGFRAAGAELLTAPQAIAALIASALGKPRATKTP